MENPGTTRVYCSVYIFTVNLQAITTYPPYLTTICRNEKITFTLEWQGKWSEGETWKWVVCVILFTFQILSIFKVLGVFPVTNIANIDSNQEPFSG